MSISVAHAAPELAEQEVAKAYEKARGCYVNLMLNENSQKLRGNWERCMTQFAAIARDYAETSRGPDALYTLANLYQLLSQQSHSKEDAAEAYARFDEFTVRYRKHRYYDDALYKMAVIKLYTFGDTGKAKRLLRQIIRWNPDGDRVGDAKNLLARIKSGKVKAGEPEPVKPQGALLQAKPVPLPPVRPEPVEGRGSTSSPRTGNAAPAIPSPSTEKKSPAP